MFRPALIAAAFALAANPAAATEWMYCSDDTDTVTVGMLMGAADTVAIVGIVLSNADRVWASHTAYGPGEEVSLGGAFEDATMLLADFMDKDFTLLARLRLFKADEPDLAMPRAVAGTLQMPGQGVWAVACSGP